MKGIFHKVALVLTACLAVACTKKEQSQEAANAADSNKPVQIEYWHVNSETFGGAGIKDLIAKFNASQDDVVVVEKYNPDMYKGLTQNLQIAIVSQKYPAVIQMGYSFLHYADENFQYITPQEVVEKYFPEDKEFLNQEFLPNVLALGQIDGKQVGIPYSISNPIVYYNADLFKAAGLNPDNPPKTWDEIKAAAEAIRDKTGNYGLFMQEYADNWAQQALIEGNGAEMIVYENGVSVPKFSSDESAEAWQFLADMVQDKSALHASNDEGFQTFLNGKIGMVITTIGKRENFQTGSNFDLRGTKFPLFGDNERKLPAGGNLLMIMSKKPEEQKAAWQFMKFLLSDESTEVWTKATGYLPPTIYEKGTGIDKFITENQLMSVAASQMPDMGKWASFTGPNGLQAEQLLIDVRDIILSGEKSAKEALVETEKKINDLL